MGSWRHTVAGLLLAGALYGVGWDLMAPPALAAGAAPPAGTADAALSSKVSVTPSRTLPPPQSAMSMTFCPAGPTSSTSTSSGQVWL